MIRSYLELITIPTFIERLDYLSSIAKVGETTFDSNRWRNQSLYSTREWHRLRDQIITRDFGCDLGIPGEEIRGKIIIHHINPLTLQQVIDVDPQIFDPNNLICTSHDTHNAIHYGSNIRPTAFIERSPNDTTLWRSQ